MWNYEKRLQFPVNITRPNAKIAQIIISQYGGPDGEAAASFRYLSQRYSMPYNKVAGLLTDIGTEELGWRGWNNLSVNLIFNFTHPSIVTVLNIKNSNKISIPNIIMVSIIKNIRIANTLFEAILKI